MSPADGPTGHGAGRVLVVRLDNIGDVLMLGPALRALRGALPDAELTALVSPAGAQALPLPPWVDDVIVHQASWQDVSGAPVDTGSELTLVEQLRQRRFDAAFVFTGFSQSPWPPVYVCALAAIPYRVGKSKEFGRNLLSTWVRAAPDHGHQVDRNNSGPLHLADAVRRPTVVLCSGTEHETQWAPRSSPHRLLRRVTACSPCFGFDCPCELDCLDIEPDEVAASGLELLEATQEEVRPSPCVPCGS